jgi:hypothetical protein
MCQMWAWSTYTFANSYGSGAAHVVTVATSQCGLASWYTEVSATVTTGTLNNGCGSGTRGSSTTPASEAAVAHR